MTAIPVGTLPLDVRRGLIIREPWITLILEGRKTWEMRAKRTNLRAPIALIRAGSGMIVGTAELMDCLERIGTPEAMARQQTLHAIPPDSQLAALKNGWSIPWVLGSARYLASPIPYAHRNGCQNWVKLNET